MTHCLLKSNTKPYQIRSWSSNRHLHILLTVTIPLKITYCLHSRVRQINPLYALLTPSVCPSGRRYNIITSLCHAGDRHEGRYPIWMRLTVVAATWTLIPWFQGYQSGRDSSIGIWNMKDAVISNYDSRRYSVGFENRSRGGKNRYNALTVEWE